jgi:hypothetical protein
MELGQHINVDVHAISTLAHHCTGCTRTDACCCAVHEVCASAREMKTISGALPLAAKYCPDLKVGNGYDNVFDEVERGLFAIDTHENGLCVFAYHAHAGIRCSLHSAAIQIGLSPHLLKPSACSLWPLVLRQPPDAAMSICDDALRFPCNRKVKAGTISHEILDSIDKLLGGAVCSQILKAAQAGRKRTRARLISRLPRCSSKENRNC